MWTETGSPETRSVRRPCLARPAISLSPLDALDHPLSLLRCPRAPLLQRLHITLPYAAFDPPPPGRRREQGAHGEVPGAGTQACKGCDILRRMPPSQAQVRQDRPLFVLQAARMCLHLPQWLPHHRPGHQVRPPSPPRICPVSLPTISTVPPSRTPSNGCACCVRECSE